MDANFFFIINLPIRTLASNIWDNICNYRRWPSVDQREVSFSCSWLDGMGNIVLLERSIRLLENKSAKLVLECNSDILIVNLFASNEKEPCICNLLIAMSRSMRLCNSECFRYPCELFFLIHNLCSFLLLLFLMLTWISEWWF